MNGNWTYAYDEFNRLSTSNRASAAGLPAVSYLYQYDRFGNRWKQTVQSGSGLNMSLSFDANNHISGNAPDGNSMYDAAGNLRYDVASNLYYRYDAENRLINVSASPVLPPTITYTYNGLGQRVEKNLSGTKTDYLYDLAGHQVTTFQAAGTWQRGEIYAGDRHLGTYYPNTTYLTYNDWLGTEHYRTDNLGNLYETCYNLPFGDGQTCAGNDVTPLHFTGKERDTESGLDYFGARYNASSMGRFTSPDPKLMTARHLAYPQKWNKYAYVQNNPLASIDPDGLDDFKIFVNFGSGDVAAKSTPNWNAIKTGAEQRGHTVTIYSGESANSKNYQDALSSKGSHVISVGHSVESSPTTASGIMLGNGSFVGQGADPNNKPMQAPQNVQAASVDIFSCNSTSLSGQYSGAGTFVGVDSGGNGTNSVTLEQATAAFLQTATSQSANSPVNLDAATSAAQKTVTNSNNLTPVAPGAPPINIDKGDTVKEEKKQ